MNHFGILSLAVLASCSSLLGDQIDSSEAEAALKTGDLDGARRIFDELAQTDPHNEPVATGQAYVQLLAGEYELADETLSRIEASPETNLRRALVAFRDADLDSVKVLGIASGRSEGLLLAAQVQLIDLEGDDAVALLHEVDGPVAAEFIRRLRDPDPAMTGSAEAAALWSMGERGSACETAGEVVETLSDDLLRNDELLLWAGRSASIGLAATAQALLDGIDAVPVDQNWRYQATQAMIWHVDGQVERASARFAALDAQVSAGAVPADGLADAMATAEVAGEARAFPCQDGWVACMVDGERLEGPFSADADGFPVPTDLPVGYYDLAPQPGLEAFGPLSVYELQMADPVEEPPQAAVAEPSEPAAAPVVEPAPRTEPPIEPTTVQPESRSAPEPSVRAETAIAAPPAPFVPSESEPPPVLEQEVDIAVVETDIVAVSEDAVMCDDLFSLEPPALLGRLSSGQIACLEGRLADALPLTILRKVSRVLMMNAFSARDMDSWQQLIHHHLTELDQSDPNLCYRYALFLTRNLPARAADVIFWADRALENRTVWVGDNYTTRVFSLYKIRAVAAQSLWQAAAEQGDVDNHRNVTRVYAREWLEYARAASKDTTKALALCVSAAGTESYCSQ